MQRLYESILAYIGDRIVQYRIIDGDMLMFELYLLDGRTQLVFAVSHYDDRLEKERLMIYSRIGTISEHVSASVVLAAASKFPQINFSMGDDHLVSAGLLTDLDEAVDKLWLDLLTVAVAADALEGILFEWDIE